QPAVFLKVDLLAERGSTFHALTRDGDGGAAAGELLFALAQTALMTAEGADDLSQNVAPTPRPTTTATTLDQRRLSLRYPRTQPRRRRIEAATIYGRIFDDFGAAHGVA